jgi:uncharacterized protein (TIGR02145 family)
MKKSIIFISTVVVLIFLTSNETIINEQERHIFKLVKIKDQVWMAENLNVSCYNNGDTIPQIKNPSDWSKLKSGAWCYYNNKAENGEKYGKLYNWYAVHDPRGLAPRGFHIPTDAEWTRLIENLGEEEAGAKIKATKGWKNNSNSSNDAGFSAFPGGYRYFVGSYLYEGNNACFWTATESQTKNKAWGRTLHSNFTEVGRDDGSIGSGLSVRCIVDSNIDFK